MVARSSKPVYERYGSAQGLDEKAVGTDIARIKGRDKQESC